MKKGRGQTTRWVHIGASWFLQCFDTVSWMSGRT